MTSMRPREAESAAVHLAGFGKRYKRLWAVRGVNLTVERGEIFGLIGPDAAGKSSLLKAVAGVLAFEEGRVEVFGVSLDSETAADRVKQRVGFMPQGLGLNLYPDLSVEENLDFFAELRLVPRDVREDRKGRLLAMTRLEPFRRRAMKHLSGGMKQKLGLVCTLIHEPELVILDEPTTGVDPVSRREFWAILAELVREHDVTALVSTAYMDEASRFDRLALMFRGAVLAAGTPAAVERLTPGVEVAVRVEPQLDALDRLKKTYEQVEMVGPWLHVFVEDPDADRTAGRVRDALAGLDVQALEVNEPELEDVFVALIRRQPAGDVRQPEHETAPSTEVVRFEGSAITARDLVKEFGGFRAVDRVSFDIAPGEIFGLLGPNGAGKTTVIKMLTGILRPSGGQGRVAGADMQGGSARIKERIGYVSQAFSLYLDLTVAENIRLFAGIYGLDRRESEGRLRGVVDLARLRGYEAALTAQLPMGVRQRLALGCALVHRPSVLFLDEPTSGVDPLGRRAFWSILLRLARQEAVAILVTTHYMSEAEHCDRLALMHAGRIAFAGSPRQMKEALIKEAGLLLHVVTDRPAFAVAALERAGFHDVTLYGSRIHLLSREVEEDQRRVRRVLTEAGFAQVSFSTRPPTLEDVFVHRVHRLEEQQAQDHQTVGGRS